MLHYLIAAGIGAALSTVAYVGVQLWTGKPITWKGVAVSAIGGLVAGVLCATPGGVAALQAGGARALTFVAADGAIASGTEKVADNLLNKKPLGEGVPEAVAWGTATAPVAYLGLRGYTQQLSKVFFPAAAEAYAAADAAQAAGDAAATAVRHGVRSTAVNIANALAIAGGNPAVARALEGSGAIDKTKPADPATTTSDTTVTPPVDETPVEPSTELNDTTPVPPSPTNGRGMIGALGASNNNGTNP